MDMPEFTDEAEREQQYPYEDLEEDLSSATPIDDHAPDFCYLAIVPEPLLGFRISC